MLAGTLDFNWTPSPPVEEVESKKYIPEPHAQSYHRPPKARTHPKRVKPEPMEAGAIRTGDVSHTKPRRAPSTTALHDPGLRRIASVLAKPASQKKGDLSEDPTRRLQAMLKKQS